MFATYSRAGASREVMIVAEDALTITIQRHGYRPVRLSKARNAALGVTITPL